MNTNIEHVSYCLPNIKLHVDRDKYPKARAEIYQGGILDEVIKKLALKFPTHIFTGDCRRRGLNDDDDDNVITCIYADRITIKSVDGDVVGEIASYGGDSVNIKGNRVREVRVRKRYIETIDLKRAVAIATKILVAPRPNEDINKSRAQSNTEINEKRYGANNQLNREYRYIMEKLTPTIIGNFEAFTEFLRGVGVAPEELESSSYRLMDLPDRFEMKRGMDEIYEAIKNNKGYMVQLKADKYIVSHDNKEPVVYVQDTLPDVIKRGVGMLKLTTPDSAITDIGHKGNNDNYFLLNPKEDK